MIGRSLVRKIYSKFKGPNIMMLHHVTNEDKVISPCVLSEENFLAFIEGKTFSDIVTAIEKPMEYDGRYILTFDDNLKDLYSFTYQICKQQSIPFTAFISSELLDHEGYITTAQLIEMAHDPLVTIGSHGASHIRLTECDKEKAQYEIIMSKKKLENILDQEITLFAFPNGMFTKRDIKIIKKIGYKFAFGVKPRRYNVLTKIFSRYNIPRINLTNQTIVREESYGQ